MKTFLTKITTVSLALLMVISGNVSTVSAKTVDDNMRCESLEPANTVSEIDLSQLDTMTTEDGKTLYDVTSLMSTYSSTQYLGSFTFTNVNTGGARTINDNRIRFIVDFKKADSQPTDIDLEVSLRRIYYENGQEYHLDRGTQRLLSMNSSLTSDGYHHATTDWININDSELGKQFCIHYDAMTEYGKVGTGAYRRASVRIWMEIY